MAENLNKSYRYYFSCFSLTYLICIVILVGTGIWIDFGNSVVLVIPLVAANIVVWRFVNYERRWPLEHETSFLIIGSLMLTVAFNFFGLVLGNWFGFESLSVLSGLSGWRETILMGLISFGFVVLYMFLVYRWCRGKPLRKDLDG